MLSNKGGRGQKNREEVGAGATEKLVFIFLANRSRALRARISRASGLTKRPYLATKTAMLRRLRVVWKPGYLLLLKNSCCSLFLQFMRAAFFFIAYGSGNFTTILRLLLLGRIRILLTNYAINV